jgi:O-antigen ligase
MGIKSVIARIHIGRSVDFWDFCFFPIIVPALLAMGLGPLIALLVVRGDWVFALLVSCLIPLAVLLVKDPFMALMVWMLVMPWFPFQGVYKYLYFTVYRLLIPVALGILGLSYLLRVKEHPPIKLGLPELAMAVFVAMGVVSIFVTGSSWKTVFLVQDQFLVPFAAYGLVRFLNAQEQEFRRLVPLMVFISVVECAIGLVSWFAPQMLPSIWYNSLVGNRVTGTLEQPAAYGCMLILYFVCFYHDAMNREKGNARTVEIMAFILGVGCTFFTFTRGVWLASVLVVLGWLYLYPKATASFLAVAVPLVAIISVTLLSREFAYASARLNSTGDEGEARLVLANAGKNMFYARPILGWGFGNYDRYDWKFLERVGETTPTRWQIERGTSHHTYLTILAEMGVVGFFFYAFPVFWWLALTFKALPRLPSTGFWSRQLLIAMWLPIGAHILLAQDIDMRFFPYVLTLFWVNLGFIANIVESALVPVFR